MKLHLIYISVGIATLLLNLALTLHIMRKNTSTRHKESWDGDDVITFRLARDSNAEGATTVAEPYDDTLHLG
ncbi:MAG: hypothetical protein APF77_17470 [Clostridia bacterium BRH_c25]|nr:MAG: hypothetical protein APF77_17470 [Clostridia bacterium BRH_c25]